MRVMKHVAAMDGDDDGLFESCTLPTSLLFEVLDVLRLAHIYVLKDNHRELLGDDFKPWKWSGEVEFAEESSVVYRKLLDAMLPQSGVDMSGVS